MWHCTCPADPQRDCVPQNQNRIRQCHHLSSSSTLSLLSASACMSESLACSSKLVRFPRRRGWCPALPNCPIVLAWKGPTAPHGAESIRWFHVVKSEIFKTYSAIGQLDRKQWQESGCERFSGVRFRKELRLKAAKLRTAMRVCICISIRKRTVLLLVSTTGGNSETSSKLIKPRNPYTPKHGYHCSSIIILESLRTYLSLSLSLVWLVFSLSLESFSRPLPPLQRPHGIGLLTKEALVKPRERLIASMDDVDESPLQYREHRFPNTRLRDGVRVWSGESISIGIKMDWNILKYIEMVSRVLLPLACIVPWSATAGTWKWHSF